MANWIVEIAATVPTFFWQTARYPCRWQHPPPLGKLDKIMISTPVPRYLVPFHPKRVPHFFTDVLVIGGGLAGLRAALAVDPKLSVVVIAKQGIQESNSNYAQGGVAAVVDPDDRFEDHVADTLEAGGSLCDPAVVERVVREAPQRIARVDRVGHAVRPRRRPLGAWDAKADTATTASSTPWATPPARKSCG